MRLEAAGGGRYAILRSRDGLSLGTVELEGSGTTLTVTSLCIDPSHRGFGAGSEAAALVREGAAEAGWEVMRAWAPPTAGLAVYFWLRMGLRPLHGEGPQGGLWFERRLP